MSYRSIFGHDLSDYEIDLIVEDPIVREWWAQSARREIVLNRWQNDRTMRATMMNLLKTASKVAGVGSAVFSALTANKERPRDAQNQDQRKKLRQDNIKEVQISPDGNAQVGDKRDREGDWKAPDEPDETHPPIEQEDSGEREELPEEWWEDDEHLPDNWRNDLDEDWAKDLIPEIDRQEASDMEVDATGPIQPEAASRQATSSGGNSGISKETPISSYPSLTYGLQETHTTILPWTCWISAGGLDKTTPAQLRIRMNAIQDMLDVTTEAAPSSSTPATTKGFYNRPFNMDGRVVGDNDIIYPEDTGNAATNANEKPQWATYWEKLYDYYTVLGCEYEIILYNPQSQPMTKVFGLEGKSITGPDTYVTVPLTIPIMAGWYNTDIVVGKQFDTYTDVAGFTGNHMPLANYADVRYYKNIQWTPVKGGSKAVIRGTYKPGQAKRNIKNDGDAKTWTATGTSPNFKEILTLNFWTDPFYNAQYIDAFSTDNSFAISSNGSNMYGCCNIEVNLKYIVQFKDLKLQARYPNTVINNQDIFLELSERTPIALAPTIGHAHHRVQ